MNISHVAVWRFVDERRAPDVVPHLTRHHCKSEKLKAKQIHNVMLIEGRNNGQNKIKYQCSKAPNRFVVNKIEIVAS